MRLFRIITPIILIALIITSFYFGLKSGLNIQKIQPQVIPPLLTYRNSSYNFAFNYPKSFSFVSPVGYNLAEPIVTLASSQSQPGTNLTDTTFSVSVEVRSPSDTKYCYTDPFGKPMTQTKTINNINYYYAETADAGAGNLYTTHLYRTSRNTPGTCQEIALTVHTTNLANYPPSSNLKEADKAKAFTDLESILSTFSFTN